jgi:SAM-dependent methyltransferase
MHRPLARKKERNWLLSVLYRAAKPLLAPFSKRKRLAFLLDLEWIFARFAHEASARYFAASEHPIVRGTASYVLSQLPPGSSVLDLGCGAGDLGAVIARAGHEVLGVDHQRSLIERGRAQYGGIPNFRLEHGDARDFLRKEGRKFDLLLLSHVLEHLDAPVDFLREFAPHFRYVYLETPDNDAIFLNQFREPAGAKLLYSDPDHVVEFDRDELAKVAKLAGLSVEHSEFRYGMLRLWCRTGN